MSLALRDPPESLGVQYDLHGIRCDLRPRAERSFAVRAGLGVFTGVLSLVVVGALTAGVLGWWTTSAAGWLGLIALAIVAAGLLFFVTVIDQAEQLDHYEARLGEGWLVLRFADQGSEIRIDLCQVRACAVELPDIRLQDDAGEVLAVPMGGHEAAEIHWMASAIDQAVRDARQGDLPAPAELLQLLSAPREER